MKAFTHIDQFYQVVRSVQKLNADPDRTDEGKILGLVEYIGTVKLHGTNAGIALTSTTYVPQSRSREVSVEDDNLGWAKFITGEAQMKAIRDIEWCIRHDLALGDNDLVTIFGEWCGPGIQKGCAIHQLPSRQFVSFAAVVGTGDDSIYLDAVLRLDNEFAEEGIYSILDVDTWSLAVDFNSPESCQSALDYAKECTLEVEKQCPWAKRFGVDGVGEGIVWTPVGKHQGNTNLYFKTKGEKHQSTGPREKDSIDPAKLASAEAFVNFMVTENRLSQGIDHLVESGLVIEPKTMGVFLKWIGNDVQREGDAELEANALEWKDVAKGVTAKARDWFLAKAREI